LINYAPFGGSNSRRVQGEFQVENIECNEKKAQKRPYAIRLSDKATKVLQLRRRTLYTMGRLNWVEDGIFVVIEQIMFGSDKLSDYLQIRYPKSMPESRRRNDTEDERKTLKYRFRYLFRCLDLKAEYYEELEQWKFSGLEFALEAFVDIMRQALGEDIGRRLNEFYWHFRSIWVAVNPNITCAEDFRREVRKLVDEVDEVFELMLAASLKLEESEAGFSRAEESMARAAKALESAAREQRQTSRIVAKVAGVAASRPEVADDEYGRYAGLDAFNEAQRTELKAAIDMSHRDYPLVRCPKRTEPSLSKLAARCWRANQERFEALAKLKTEAGYKNVDTFKTALYGLMKKYPSADHFVWKS